MLMYTAVSGVYENGNLTLQETPPTNKKSKVLVMFMEELEPSAAVLVARQPGGLTRLTHLQGQKMELPLDFNAPLEDLNEYM